MKSINSTRWSPFWTYICMALVIFQLSEFAYGNPFETQPRFILCDYNLYNALDYKCPNGYDLNKNPNLASICCSQGCASFQLDTVCIRRRLYPTQERFILCGHDFYKALDSKCINGYDLNNNPNLAQHCCRRGCTSFELDTVCIRRRGYPPHERSILCGKRLDIVLDSVCEYGYDLRKNPTLSSMCCHHGCSSWSLVTVCKRRPRPDPYWPPYSNEPRYILCGYDLYTALNSVCIYGYELKRDSTLPSKCCHKGCKKVTLATVCN
ncbi:uncharacterized protein LOC117179532 [Belonocnema kinseyi]|uniref:uncharacterized protein LOC117179532 n=1 Tax=Belonocnema kinseyi TaxID=2817044 RepID=UPI00143D1F89|nr:uncharacterized protein LOC117179532 [Belonocnema kinseyi]